MSQVNLLYQSLLEGPKTQAELFQTGVNPAKLTARMSDLRKWLQPQGMDWININGTYELVKPEE